MGFPRRRFSGFEPIPWTAIHNKQMVESALSSKIVSNGLAAHAHSMHNLASIFGNAPEIGDTRYKDYVVSSTKPKQILRLPLNQIVSGAGNDLHVWVRCYRSTMLASAFVYAFIPGLRTQKVYITGAASTLGWYRVKIRLPSNRSPMLTNETEIVVALGADWDYSTDFTIRVESISMHEGWNRQARPWIDTSGANNKLALDDMPYSAAFERIFVDKLSALQSSRMGRANIFNKHFAISQWPTNLSYLADERTFGSWIVRKGEGITQIDAKLYAVSDDTQTFKVSLWSIDSIAYDTQAVNFTVGEYVTGQVSGARGLIVADADAGAAGVLALSDVDGTFQNNEALLDDAGGLALADGTNAGAVLIDDDTEPYTGPGDSAWHDFALTGINSAAAEYEITINAKEPVGSAATYGQVSRISAWEHQGAAVDYALPNPVHTETEDDIISDEWSKLKSTLDFVRNRRTQIILQDAHYVQAVGFRTDGPIVAGILGLSHGVKRLHAVVFIRRPNLDETRKQDVTGAAGSIVNDTTVTGATSGATGILDDQDISGGAGSITVSSLSGAILNGETITFGSGGSATADGVPYKFENNSFLTLQVFDQDGNTLTSHQVNCIRLARGQIVRVDLVVDAPPVAWEDYSTGAFGPYQFNIEAYFSDRGDYIETITGVVYEEPLFPGGWDVYIGDEN